MLEPKGFIKNNLMDLMIKRYSLDRPVLRDTKCLTTEQRLEVEALLEKWKKFRALITTAQESLNDAWTVSGDLRDMMQEIIERGVV